MRSLTAAAILTLCAGSALGQVVRISCIYTNYLDLPNSVVPGRDGLPFNPGLGGTTNNFEPPFLSPNGQFWIISAKAAAATSEDETILIGGGTTGFLACYESQVINADATPGDGGAFLEAEGFGIFDEPMAINNAGQFALSGLSRNSPSNANGIAVRGVLPAGLGSTPTFRLIGREGSPAFGLAGITLGTRQSGVNITADGRVAWVSQTMGGDPGATALNPKQAAYLGTTLLAQTRSGTLSEPTPLAPSGPFPWRAFNLPLGVRADGNQWLATGFLASTPDDDILVLDNQVLLQTGSPLPSDPEGSIVSTILGATMHPSGLYFVRGSTFSGNEFVEFSTGQSTATDRPIVAGSEELWDDSINTGTFTGVAINGIGDFVISGFTSDQTNDGGDPPVFTRNTVVVLNSSRVLVREGDPVDLNGNGQNDDEAVVLGVNFDSMALSDDGWLYLTLSTNRASDIPEQPLEGGQAFARLRAFCPADVGAQGGVSGRDGVLDNNDFVSFIDDFFAQRPRADFGRQGGEPGADGAFDNNDFIAFIDQFFSGCL